jgi:hypothetical protein
MRNALIVAVIAAGTLQDMRASQAYEAPWCAVTNIGHDVAACEASKCAVRR